MLVTYLIVPAWSDQAGQCRIVRTFHDSGTSRALSDYRRNPDVWDEAGVMNSRGRIVCLTALPQIYQDMERDQPLSAGLVYTYDVDTGEPA